MQPTDGQGIFGVGDFRLPDKSVDVMSQAHGRRFIERQQRVEQPLITARVHLQKTYNGPHGIRQFQLNNNSLNTQFAITNTIY